MSARRWVAAAMFSMGWALGLSGCASTPRTQPEASEAATPDRETPNDRPASDIEEPLLTLSADEGKSEDSTEKPRKVRYEAIPMPQRSPEADLKLLPMENPGDPMPVSIDFDNSEMTEVIRVFSALLDFDYLLEEGVKGKITVKADVKVDRAELWTLFRNLLSINRLSLIQRDGIYLIGNTEYQKPNAKIHDRRTQREIDADEGLIVQLIPVRYMPAQEMSELLKSFAGPGTLLQVYHRSNMLILVDTPEAAVRLMAIKDQFDAPNLKGIKARLYELEDVQAEELATELANILEELGIDSLKSAPAGVTLIPIPRLDKLIVLSGDEKNFDILEYWIEKLDHVEHQEGLRVFVYRVKNGKAEDIANLFSKMLESGGETTEKSQEGDPSGVQEQGLAGDLTRGAGPQTLTPPGRGEAKPTGFTTRMSGEVRITNDTYSNSLIIQASNADYKALRKILEEVDVLPKQVLVETIIADVSLSDSNTLGIGWSINKALQGSVAGAATSAYDKKPGFELDSGALSINYLDTAMDLAGIISLAASQTEVKVLSSPTLWATDNISATINIGQQIPISVSSVQIDSAQSGNTTVSRSAQYQRVGLGLSFVPRITDSGIITMEMSITISESSSVGGEAGLPVILERSASTSFWARDGQTIILGGLIEETSSDFDEGIPFLMDIPILGYLFGSKEKLKRKTELVLLIRPHIIRDLEEADYLVNQFTQSVKKLRLESGWMDGGPSFPE